MKRREFITLLGGAAAAWPFVARAQQAERVRRIGVLMNLAADDPESQRRMSAFIDGLRQLMWIDGGNVQIDTRWGAADAGRIRKYAAELGRSRSRCHLGRRQYHRRTIDTDDPQYTHCVRAGDRSCRRRLRRKPCTAGRQYHWLYSVRIWVRWKMVGVAKQVAPGVTRVAVIRDSALTSGTAQWAAIQAVAPSFGIELSPIGVSNSDEIERAISTFARAPSPGLIVTSSTLAISHRKRIVESAALHRLPAVYPYRYFVTDGGLISYGPDQVDSFRRAAGYIDRILKGEKPAFLPVQAPTKYELVINLKTPSSLGLGVPPSLLARADEVIE